jgi:hypothetical protein
MDDPGGEAAGITDQSKGFPGDEEDEIQGGRARQPNEDSEGWFGTTDFPITFYRSML